MERWRNGRRHARPLRSERIDQRGASVCRPRLLLSLPRLPYLPPPNRHHDDDDENNEDYTSEGTRDFFFVLQETSSKKDGEKGG